MSNNKKTEEAVDESLHFEKITWDNFEAIINLHVKKEQQNYVARNKDSLVHACVCMTSEGKQVAGSRLPYHPSRYFSVSGDALSAAWL